jgi:hypothetical protein
MWSLQNTTPFHAARGFARDRSGAEFWLVAVKSTFRIIDDGSTELAAEQEPVSLSPRFVGEPSTSSLVSEGDLPLTKVRTDVLVRGHAVAPGGRPATEVDVTLTVGERTKVLRVTGDRRWSRVAGSLVSTRPTVFERMPITYERAFGGRDPIAPEAFHAENPVGVGYALSPDHLDGSPLPNVEVPDTNSLRGPSTGYGPVASYWSPRARYAGTYDATWKETRRPLLPVDFDDQFYQCAPQDQQFASMRGGESIRLHNMTPTGLLSFRIPRIALVFTTRFTTGDVEHRGALHTVLVEPDVPRVVVWHTQLRCQGKIEQLRETIVRQKSVLES